MTTRDRFHPVMNAQPFGRLPVVEWAGWGNPWSGTTLETNGVKLSRETTPAALCRG